MRFIVAFPPPVGTSPGSDASLRQKLTEAFGKPFVVDNARGAGGIIAEEIARVRRRGLHAAMVCESRTRYPPAPMKRRSATTPLRDRIPVSLLVSVPQR